MAYFNVCPNCGSNLDPGERCDCKDERAKKLELNQKYFNRYLCVEKTAQLLEHEKIPEVVDSGSVLITKETMYTEENQKLLFPF